MYRCVTQAFQDFGGRGIGAERFGAILAATLLSGCALRPAWHWEKEGASEAQYAQEVNQCKAATYSGTDGMVTQESVRRMHACLEARGWRKVEGRPGASGG